MSRIVTMQELVGNTPLVRLTTLSEKTGCTLLGKLESANPGGSVKDRAALAMVEAAEHSGDLTQGGHIIEPTSGNTGVALAFIGVLKGYSVTLVMPDSMSIERRAILKAYGANVVLTPGHLGMAGAIQTAEELVEKTPGAFMPQQFKNPANPQKHRDTTAEEIWRDTGGVIDAFVAGVGTGGTVSGVGSVLKRYQPRIHIVGVEPADSAVISGQAPGPHMIQGIGAGFIPGNLDRAVLDEVLTVRNDDALGMGRYLARTEGILSGISSGANVHAAVELAKRPEFKGKTIVCIICDTGERYLSTVLFDQ